MLNVTFFGVRGSTPCPADANRRYGGNTACVAVERAGSDPIVFDLGTGLRYWGETLPQDGSFHGSALVTHLHWDHVQGLPFFVPANREGATFDIYGPSSDNGTLGEAFAEFVCPPYFPVRTTDLMGEIRFHDVANTDLEIGDAVVKVRDVPHVGHTNGYRVEWDGSVIAYLSDHQQPQDGGFDIAESALELCDGADLVIHDAQYTPEEFEVKAHWGHCTVDYAVHIAQEAGARQLALFHHDPEREDDDVDRLLAAAQASTNGHALEVVAAAEGLTVALT